MPRPEIDASVRAFPGFAGLAESELAVLAESSELVSFEPGQSLMVQGHAGDCAYVLLEGSVEVLRDTLQVTKRGPGDWLGELALIDAPVRSASVRALTKVEALSIGRDGFEALLKCPEFVRRMLFALSAKLREGDVLLAEALEDLRRLQALKDDLYSLLVHDVRNPLTCLRACLSLMKSGGHDKQLFDLGERNVGYIQTLLEDVLDVRLLEEDQLPLQLKPVRLDEVVRQAAAAMAQAGTAREVELVVEPGGPVEAVADAKLVRRAVENLVSNSIKYAPMRSRVTLAVSRQGEHALVDVADTGPGVPAELRGKLFRKFGSIEMERGSPRRGYGLGLHLVTLVAEAHRGSVSILDKDGHGAVFRLSLPVRPRLV